MSHQYTILIAPGPYKECLSSRQVAAAMKRGVIDVHPGTPVLERPLCDGGSGIAALLAEATKGRLVSTRVMNPLGEPIEAAYGLLGDGTTAVVESAAACGLHLVPVALRDPQTTSTFGVGQLIRHAVEVTGARRVIVGCGDSATNDCGLGLAAAIGAQCEFTGGSVDVPCGADLLTLTALSRDGIPSRIRDTEFVVACNLTSILCGPEGTSRVYGPQKGASAEQVLSLEKGVERFTDVVFQDLRADVAFLPGAGGAGGLASALYALLGARLTYSLDVVNAFLDLDSLLEQSDLVLTGEGMIDDRTATGKVACGVALRAKRFDLPVIAIVGSIAPDHEDVYYNGIDMVVSIQDGPLTREESVGEAERLIEQATSRIVRGTTRLRGVRM